MANHVNTHVRFEKINEAGLAKLQELYSRIRSDGQNYEWFSDMWGLDKEITDKYNWNIKSIRIYKPFRISLSFKVLYV